MRDGSLRQMFQRKLPHYHWTHIESGMTAQGVSDTNACYEGNEFWIEYKLTTTFKIKFRPFQPMWIHKRIRHGGRVWIAVRQMTPAGVRLGSATDNLWLFHGSTILDLLQGGLQRHLAAGKWEDGPGGWDWIEIDALLRAPTSHQKERFMPSSL